jgi:UDP-glucose:(heptosyl)LPS alpha-1,3-glucosyltransferase
MRIALVHLRHRETGGTERYLQQMAAHLAGAGHQVTVVCRSHERPPHPAVRFVVLRHLALGGAWRLWAFARAVERHLKATDYDVVFALGRTWTHDVIRLGGGCQQTYLDLAHTAARRRWHGFGVGLEQRIVLAIEARALAPGAYDRVITNSMMVKRDVMERHHVPAERVHVIYNGVDLTRFDRGRHAAAAARLRAQCGFDDGAPVVLFLGTGYGRKGLRRLLDAFPGLLRTAPDARLMVVGYDSAQAAFAAHARRLGVERQVRFLGGRRDAEVCFAAADLYALPTYYDPFANTTLEALACGLPVITTDANGASEVLGHRVEGSVVPAHGATGELLEELRFWTDPARLRSAAVAARSRAERYPEARTVGASTEILEEVARHRAVEGRAVRGRGRVA